MEIYLLAWNGKKLIKTFDIYIAQMSLYNANF